jgi:hypothetical protein
MKGGAIVGALSPTAALAAPDDARTAYHLALYDLANPLKLVVDQTMRPVALTRELNVAPSGETQSTFADEAGKVWSFQFPAQADRDRFLRFVALGGLRRRPRRLAPLTRSRSEERAARRELGGVRARTPAAAAAAQRRQEGCAASRGVRIGAR